MALAPGTTVGSYEVTALLGSGGMGDVYRARDTKLGRDVALKVLPHHFASDPERLARFTREAHVLASLNHPHIAAIYGIEESDGSRALVLELVEGETLADRIAREPIPLDEALPIARQIAEALEGAHEKGIIHRDLKPANIKITPDGIVKVLDFGLAKLAAPQDIAADISPTLSPTITSPALVTGVGVLLGTAAYMSPEQAKGREADRRSDVWAFGCVLFEMLTGKRAFEGDDVSDTLASVLKGEPDWTKLSSDVPRAIRQVLRGSLEKDRRRRMGEVSTALFLMRPPEGDADEEGEETTVDLRGSWRRSMPAVVVSSTLVALIVGFLAWSFEPSPSTPATVSRFAFALPDSQQLRSNTRSAIAISPDGSTIVYAANGQLYLRAIDELEPKPIPGTAQDAGNPFFSPDGRWVGYYSRSEQKLKKIATTGGAAVNICDFRDPEGFGPVWNADGAIYWGAVAGILRVPADGGAPETVITLEKNQTAHRPQILPGGDALLFGLSDRASSSARTWDAAQIVVQSLKSGERSVVIAGGGDARYVPTGHVVYALGTTVLAASFDVRTLKVGSPVPLIEGVRRASNAGADAQFAVSATGSMVYVAAETMGERVLALVDRSGVVRRLRLPPGLYESPRVSPDGKQLAMSTQGETAAIWIYNLNDSAPLRRLTFEGRSFRPLWTRDGQRIVFTSDREEREVLYWQRADGSSAERLGNADQGVTPQSESLSADGHSLIFSSRIGGGNRSISMLSLGGAARPQVVFEPPASNASVSPDGRWIAYQGPSTSPRGDVFVEPWPRTGERHQVTTDGGAYPLWSRDGEELFFVGDLQAGQLMSVPVQTQRGFTFERAMPLPVEGIVGPGPRSYDVTPDGKFVVVMAAVGARPETAPNDQIHVTLNWFEELKRLVPAK